MQNSFLHNLLNFTKLDSYSIAEGDINAFTRYIAADLSKKTREPSILAKQTYYKKQTSPIQLHYSSKSCI